MPSGKTWPIWKNSCCDSDERARNKCLPNREVLSRGLSHNRLAKHGQYSGVKSWLLNAGWRFESRLMVWRLMSRWWRIRGAKLWTAGNKDSDSGVLLAPSILKQEVEGEHGGP